MSRTYFKISKSPNKIHQTSHISKTRLYNKHAKIELFNKHKKGFFLTGSKLPKSINMYRT